MQVIVFDMTKLTTDNLGIFFIIDIRSIVFVATFWSDMNQISGLAGSLPSCSGEDPDLAQLKHLSYLLTCMLEC